MAQKVFWNAFVVSPGEEIHVFLRTVHKRLFEQIYCKFTWCVLNSKEYGNDYFQKKKLVQTAHADYWMHRSSTANFLLVINVKEKKSAIIMWKPA